MISIDTTKGAKIKMQLNSLINYRMKTLALGMLAVVFAFAMQMALAPEAHATTYNVNTISNPTGCGFLEALAEVAGSPVPGASCAASDGNDTINIAPGSYTLAAAPDQVAISGNLTIDGGNATQTTINGNGFAGFTLAGEGNYAIKNLTLTNFTSTTSGQTMVLYAGSGSLTADKLIVNGNNCTATDPETGAGSPVCALLAKVTPGDATVTISNSSFFDNDAIFLIANSISDQDFGAPGNSTLNVFNNTIYNNRASILATVNNFEGVTATTNFYNNTVFDNTLNINAGATILVNVSSLPTYSAVVNLRNNIVGQTKGTGEFVNCFTGAEGIISSQGGNVVDDSTCDAFLTGSNDKKSTNPQLGSFVQNNNTWVLPLLANSPALENAVSGTPATPTVDQRGVARPQGSASDSGAYEYVYPTPGLPSTGGILASTGFDMRLLSVIAGLLVFAGIGAAGYSLRKR